MANELVISSYFTLHWKIKNFLLYLQLNGNKLESPTFSIRCLEITKWCISLLPTADYVSCSITRLQDTDDLNEIDVNYSIYIVDECGDPHFMRKNTKKLDRDTRFIEESTFLEHKLLQPKHLTDNSLEFQCDIVLEVNLEEAAKWNFNSDLLSLSNDLLRLYETKEASDMILNIGNVEFKVHKFILQSRCPSIIVTSASSLALTQNSDETQSSSGNSNNISENESEESLSNSLIDDIERLMNPAQLPVYCLDCESFAESLLIEGGSCEDAFTIPVCEAILRYIYSGRVNITDSDIKWRLFAIGLHHNLFDLTNKLQDVADEYFAVTDILADRAMLLWDLSTFHDWKKFLFPLMTKFIHLSKQPKKIICVRITMLNTKEKGHLLYIFFKLIESEYPITVKLDLAIYHITREDCLQHVIYTQTFWNEQEWHCAYIEQPMYLAFGDIYFFSTFTICNRHETRITRQVFYDSSGDSFSNNKSLRQLSTDFSKSYSNPSNNNYYDLSLNPNTSTVLAHKLIVYARSPVFREELLPKMQEKGMIVHKVLDTNLIVLRKVIEYMYKGILILKDFEPTEELRKTAEKFKITALVNSCNVTEEDSQDKVEDIKQCILNKK